MFLSGKNGGKCCSGAYFIQITYLKSAIRETHFSWNFPKSS